MKKLLVSLLLMLPLCGFAQKGMQGIGGGLGLSSCVDGDCALVGGSIKYQNHLTNRMRIIASFEYMEGNTYHNSTEYRYELIYNWEISLNYFLKDVARLRPYVAFGLFLGVHEFSDYDYNYYDSEWITGESVGVNFGIGLDYRISYHFSMQAELVGLIFSFVEDVFTIGPNIGLTYTF